MYTTAGSIKRHLLTHTGEKAYKCTENHYKSSQSSSLQTHMKTHTSEKPFSCTECDYKSSQSSNLNTHMKSHTSEFFLLVLNVSIKVQDHGI